MFYQVDVFTDKPFYGTPTAVVLENEELDFSTTLKAKIAHELNLPVTVFITKSKKADFLFSFFTPKKEISLSGHAIIAGTWLLATQGNIPRGKKSITVETKIGLYTCELNWEEEQLNKVFLVLKDPSFKEIKYDKSKLAEILGIRTDKIESNEKLPLTVADVGSPKLLVLISSKEMTDALVPKLDALERLCRRFKVSGVHLYTFDTYTEGPTCYVRQFEIIRGLPETPGSALANGALAAFLVKKGFSPPGSLIIEQGESLDRQNKVEVRVAVVDDEITTVRVGAKACVVFKFKPLVELTVD